MNLYRTAQRSATQLHVTRRQQSSPAILTWCASSFALAWPDLRGNSPRRTHTRRRSTCWDKEGVCRLPCIRRPSICRPPCTLELAALRLSPLSASRAAITLVRLAASCSTFTRRVCSSHFTLLNHPKTTASIATLHFTLHYQHIHLRQARATSRSAHILTAFATQQPTC